MMTAPGASLLHYRIAEKLGEGGLHEAGGERFLAAVDIARQIAEALETAK